MNDDVSSIDLRLTTAAVVAFAALIGTILTLAFSADPSGGQLQATVTAFAIAIAVALGSVVGNARTSA